jgi:glycosyltransferase involved in cell wall biosynthesis
MNIFLSNDYQDIDFARKNDIKNITVIPNGASEEEFIQNIPPVDIRQQLKIPKDHFLILIVGSHTGLKGHKEAIEIFKKAKIKKATLLIVGNSANHQGKLNYLGKFLLKSIANIFTIDSRKKFYPACLISCSTRSILQKITFDRFCYEKLLIVKDLTREQTIATYLEANLFLFPSNIECSPLVLFESMASKTAFLTSEVGNAKEIITWSNAGRLMPTLKMPNGLSTVDIKKSAVQLENMIKNKEEIAKMAALGNEAFKRKFTWDRISKEYEELYISHIKKQ